MNYEILLSRVIRLSMEKAIEVIEDYKDKVGFKTFAEQQRILDIIAIKANALKQFGDEQQQEALIYFTIMVHGYSKMSQEAFREVQNYPMFVWSECIGSMGTEDIITLLNRFGKRFPSTIIETCILYLPENMQVKFIERYKYVFDPEEDLFSFFYYSVGNLARLKLRELFPELIDGDILLELEDLKENELVEKLTSEKDRLLEIYPDDLVEFILLNAYELNTLDEFLITYEEQINKCSVPMFELLFVRYKYLRNLKEYGYIDERKTALLSDSDFFILFKDKFHQIGVEETLRLFDQKAHYQSNSFAADIILELLDIAYLDSDLSEYINDETIKEMIQRFVEKCKGIQYSLSDFECLEKNIGKDGKTKLIHDDYIEAIIACGKLLKARVINDKNPLFLELRNKFTKDLIHGCEKDGTFLEEISLNGLFYILAKGIVSFETIYMTKTYKGLIYLSKVGLFMENADYVTTFLTDEQLSKLNITSVINMINAFNKANTNEYTQDFMERMGLQLWFYFGKERCKYLFESKMKSNRMENLFDGLNYKDIIVNEDGTSQIHEELIHFLFGHGMMKETNSVINRLIRGEIPEYERYFTTFCNSFEDVKKACNGILSVKRVIKYYEDIDLPIDFKPDEIEFKSALKEMNTVDPSLLTEAIGLCKDARNREFSSIPKVEGQLGDFTYKILDLKDPFAVDVGYLSHCCFIVRGISYSALKHSMQSLNGRTFVVYYKGQFLTQSWVWRNGDVICFDSVEAGKTCHGMVKDGIGLVEVYKAAASEMLSISEEEEDYVQRVKVVTVGKSDYIFDGLEKVEIDPPRPLERGVYVGDSYRQQVLAGEMPEHPRYGVVGFQYKDPRKKVITIHDVNKTNVDMLDEIAIQVNSLRYRIYGEEIPIDYNRYKKMILGDGWYLLVCKDGSIESGVLQNDLDTQKEFQYYLSKYQDHPCEIKDSFTRMLIKR